MSKPSLRYMRRAISRTHEREQERSVQRSFEIELQDQTDLLAEWDIFSQKSHLLI